MEKDFSKIRPFDLEAAKAGDKVCIKRGYDEGKYVAGPDQHGKVVCDWGGMDGYSGLQFSGVESLGMAPLFWLEGSPIYKGDTIYYKASYARGDHPHCGTAATVMGMAEGRSGVVIVDGVQYKNCGEFLESMTLNKPKTKKRGFVIISKVGTVAHRVFETHDEALTIIVQKGKIIDNAITPVTDWTIVPVEWEV